MALYVVGSGIYGTKHLTEETLEVLKLCDRIFVLDPKSEVIDFLRKRFRSAEIVDCGEFYEGAPDRPTAYNRISVAVLSKCDRHRDVAFVAYGHPLFLVSAAEQIVQEALRSNIPVHCLPAVSSLDAIIASLQVEIGYAFAVFDATRIVRESRALDTTIPNFVFQLANIEDSSIQRGRIASTKMAPLHAVLSKQYPPNHFVYLVTCSNSVFEKPQIAHIPLKDLCDNREPPLSSRPTLYIPAL